MLAAHAQGDSGEGKAKSKRGALAALVVIIAIPVVVLSYLHASIDVKPLPIGKTIPRINLTSLAGKKITSGSFIHKRSVLIIFSAECPHCIAMLSVFSAMKQKYGDVLHFAGLSMSKPDTTRELVSKSRVSFPVYVGTNGEIEKAFRISMVPVTFLVDSDLVLRNEVLGEVRPGILDPSIEAFMGEKHRIER